MPPKIRSREEENDNNNNTTTGAPTVPQNDAAATAAPKAPQVLKMKAAPHVSPHLAAQQPQPSADNNKKPASFSLDDVASTTSTNNNIILNNNNNNSSKNVHSPPANVGAPGGTAFPTGPSPSNDHHNHNHHQQLHSESANVKTLHQINLTKTGPSPDREASPRSSHGNGTIKLSGGGAASNNTSNNNSKLPSRGASVQGSTAMGSRQISAGEASAREHFITKVAEKLAKVLAITKLPPKSPTKIKPIASPTSQSSPLIRAADICVPPQEKLLEVGKEIAEKLLEKGMDYAKSHYSDLCIGLENEDNELLRNKIRNRQILPDAIAAFKMVDLLSKAEKKQLKEDEEESFKSHNMKDIFRAIATIEKTIPCPQCGEKEVAVLEQGNDGGAPRFWSGGELEEGQKCTLFKCVNCDHEFSKESRY